MSLIWAQCLQLLQNELPDQQYNTWIRPLQGVEEAGGMSLLAPNRFVVDWVKDKYLKRIIELLNEQGFDGSVAMKIGSVVRKEKQAERSPVEKGQVANHSTLPAKSDAPASVETVKDSVTRVASVEVETSIETQQQPSASKNAVSDSPVALVGKADFKSNLNESFTFDSFVEGKSNQLGRAAALQVAENPGGAYNPLFIYGGVGLGKTHLMHSVGNYLVKNGRKRVVYLHSERFVADMVKALQTNAISEFKRFYRSVDALLIDDIQFFAGKERSQEEFFHTFNALLEGRQQMILTSDRYPKEITGVEERLKSRFGWGLTVAVEPPELETRVAIIKNKAMQTKMPISDETAFFIAQKICSNVRELEGALKRVIANAQFTGKPITLEFVKESLKDLLAIQDRQVSIDNIQKIVAEYYKIKTADLLSKRRNRSVARPRQVAMALAKDLTNHSLPEIGQSFGGRDHTTVLHGCRKIAELRGADQEVEQDFVYLTRMLTT